MQGDFIDDRATLTRKVLMGIQWFVNSCDRKKSMLILSDSDSKLDYEDLTLTYSPDLLRKRPKSIVCLSGEPITRTPHIL